MARRKRPVPPSRWLVPGVSALLISMVVAGAFLPAIPVTMAEAAEWRRALGGPVLPLDAPPLGAWITRLSLAAMGDSIAALRLPVLVLLLPVIWLLWRRDAVAALAVLGAPLVWVLALGGIATLLPLVAATPFALLLSWAAAPRPKREKSAPRAPWVWLGGAAALLVHLQPLVLPALIGTLMLIPRSGVSWRGPLIACAALIAVCIPGAIWVMATGGAPLWSILPAPGTVPWWHVPLALAGLGPLLLRGLRGPFDAQGVWIAALGLLLLATVLVGRPVPGLVPMLVVPLALRLVADDLRGAPLLVGLVPGALAGATLLSLSLIYAQWGAGLPAAADPHAERRADAAFCEEVLLALEEEDAAALVARERSVLLPCAWAGGLTDLPLIGLEQDRAPLALRMAQGPLALPQGAEGILVAFWPDETAAEAFSTAVRLGARAVPDHVGGERRFTLWRVGGWRGQNR